ncbi:hypothetical protein [Streptomyces sp. NBC_01465]|uniref:hypothetical protein n=1 Tax=Streptomyces sp. NBC_01465 TaxID=2903878 RepID=UPI002E2EB83E|nr:hypothetical protein [Streptomyces sp. NBC_01465]
MIFLPRVCADRERTGAGDNPQGRPLFDQVMFPVALTVAGPIAAWFVNLRRWGRRHGTTLWMPHGPVGGYFREPATA